MTWRLVVLLNLVLFACGCYPSDWRAYVCPPKYPVAPGEHGRFYEGTGEMRVVDSADVESIDSTRLMSFSVSTLDEETSYELHGIREPRLYVQIAPYHPAEQLGCDRFVSDPPEVIELSLDGSDNRFRCFEDPASDAELVLRNVGEGAGGVEQFPLIWRAELVGTYSENNGAELYEVRFHSFIGGYMLLNETAFAVDPETPQCSIHRLAR